MRCDIDPRAVQQLVEQALLSLQGKLDRAQSEEGKVHLMIDALQYLQGLLDFYRSVVPVDAPAQTLAAGEIDDDVIIQTMLEVALHQVQHLLNRTG